MNKSILLAVDLNHPSSWKKALPVAVSLARADKAKLHVLNVIPDYGKSIVGSYFPADFAEKAEQTSRKALGELLEREVPDDVDVDFDVVHGTIYRKIIESANRLGADLIVMASHRSDMRDYLIGPNAAKVVRHAPQSVYVVRGS